MTCAICENEIRDEKSMYVEQRGWARKRKGGGLHGLIEREETGRVACGECILKIKYGIVPGQINIYGEVAE